MSAPPPIEADETVLTQASTFFNFMRVTLQSILLTLAAFLISFYWTLESRRIIQQGLLYAPMKQRENIRSFLQAIEEKVGGYVRGQGILCLAIGLLSFVAYLVIGLPYALVLALIAGIMEAIPVFGPTLGAIPAIMVAFSVDPSTVVWVVVATIIIQLLENNLLVPRIMNKVVGVNSMVVLLALVTLAPLVGLAGVVLAIPMAAVVQLLLDRFVWAGEHSLEHLPTGRDQISKLRYEAQALGRDVRKQLKEKDEPASADSDEIEDSIEAITMELDRLLEKMANQEAAP
jgi:predicted PurR-regulated permease PerM